MVDDFEKFSALLDDISGGTGRHRGWTALALAPLWRQAVGDGVARHSAPLGLSKKGVLLVAVRHNVWSQELKLRQDQILERLRAIRPGLVVESLRLRVSGRMFAQTASPPAADFAEDLALVAQDEELSRAAAAADHARDPRLREAYLMALAKLARRRAAERSLR